MQWGKVQIEGLDELNEALDGIPEKISRKIVLDALKDAASPMVEEARSLAPVERGILRDKIEVRPMRRRRFGSEVSIGAFSPHAHLVENGTAPHRIDAKPGSVLRAVNGILGMTVEHPGARPQPFFRPAWAMTSRQVYENIKDSLRGAIERASERYRRRANALARKLRAMGAA